MLMTAAPEGASGTGLSVPNLNQADLPQNNILNLAGYASRFDVTDLSGDRVRRGAFSAALLSRSEKLPMLFNHETDIPIGVWDDVFEDEIGLYVKGRLFLDSADADRSARLITSGSVSGLSIGFRTRRHVMRPDEGRDLFDLELWEVSIVAFPMLPSARLTEIGMDSTDSEILDDVTSLPQANEMIKESVND
jgi:HK97 family phage prohead protease